MRRGVGKIIVGGVLGAGGLYLRLGMQNLDGGTIWPVVGVALIGWGLFQVTSREHSPPNSPPWHVTPDDERLAQVLCASVGGSLYPKLVPTPTGRRIELLASSPTPTGSEPAMVFARGWDPDVNAIVSIATLHPLIDAAFGDLLRESGYRPLLSMEGAPVVYVKGPERQARAGHDQGAS